MIDYDTVTSLVMIIYQNLYSVRVDKHFLAILGNFIVAITAVTT